MKVFPLSQAAHPGETIFSDAQSVEDDARIKDDWTFFDNLNRVIQQESWLDRDKGMVDQLRFICIEKGKLCSSPSEDQKAGLTSVAQEAHA